MVTATEARSKMLTHIANMEVKSTRTAVELVARLRDGCWEREAELRAVPEWDESTVRLVLDVLYLAGCVRISETPSGSKTYQWKAQ